MASYKPSDVVTIGGVSKSLIEWAEQLGTPVQTIIGRLKRRKSIEDACTRPIQKASSSKGKSMDADVLDVDEMQQLLRGGRNGQTDVRDSAVLVIAYRTGLRCFEITSLAVKDVSINDGTIRVQHGKGDKFRIVAMDPDGWPWILKWLDVRNQWGIDDRAPFFCTKPGGKLSDRQVRAMISRRTKRAKINKRVHAHGLRRTMASELAEEGVPIVDIATIMGHANIDTTDNYIKRINPTSALNAMKRRAWGGALQNAPAVNGRVAPGWLERLRNEIGERMALFHDARSDEEQFRAVVLLF